MATQVNQLKEENRFVFSSGGQGAGLTDYVINGNSINLTHAEIFPEMRGKGLGAIMVRQILDKLRDETSLRVVAACPFVQEFMDNNPEYQALATR